MTTSEIRKVLELATKILSDLPLKKGTTTIDMDSLEKRKDFKAVITIMKKLGITQKELEKKGFIAGLMFYGQYLNK